MFECLEQRRLLSSVTWTGKGDGTNWTDPKNWSTHHLPGVADDVTIAVAGDADHDDNGHGHDDVKGDEPPKGKGDGNGTDDENAALPVIRLASGTQSIHSLNTLDPLLITGGTLAVATTATFSADLTLVGGTLSGGTYVSAGQAMLAISPPGGTLSGVTLDTPAALNGTRATVLNGLTLQQGSVFSIDSGNTPAELDFVGSQSIDGNGSIVFNGSNPRDVGKLIPVAGPGESVVLTIGQDVTIATGTASGQLGDGALNASITNRGSIIAETPGASITISDSLENLGTIRGAVGGTINLNNNGGSFTFTSGTAQVNGVTSASDVTITGGTVVFTGSQPITIGTLHLEGGTLDGSQDILITGPSTWTGGTMTGTGQTTIAPGATLIVDNPVLHLSTRVFNNNGSVLINAGSLELDANGTHAGSFALAAGTVLALGGSSTQMFQPSSSLTGSGSAVFQSMSNSTVLGAYHLSTTMLTDAAALRFQGQLAEMDVLDQEGGALTVGVLPVAPTTAGPRVRTAVAAADPLVQGLVHVFQKNIVSDSSTVVMPGWVLQDDGVALIFAGDAAPSITLLSDPLAPGKLSLGGNVSYTGSATASIISTGLTGDPGVVDLCGSQRSFTVATAGASIDISAALSDGTIRKAGPGTLRLSGAGSYGGAILSTGTLELDNPAAAGAGPVTFSGGSLSVRAGASVTLANTFAVNASDSITLDVGSTSLQVPGLPLGANLTVSGSSGGSLAINGPLVLQHDLVIDNTVPVTIAGSISGGFGINKSGSSSLTFSGTSANSYTGTTEVNGGSLVLDNGSGPAVSGPLRINGPAMVVLAADQQTSIGTDVIFDATSGSPVLDLQGHSTAVGSISSFQAGAGVIALRTGTLTPQAGTYSGTVIGSGTLAKIGPGLLTLAGSVLAGSGLSVGGGAVALSGANAADTVGSLSIVSGARLDLGGVTFSIRYGPGASPQSLIRNYISMGALVADGYPAVGYADGADGAVTGLLSGTFVVKGTLPGDANLDGRVDFADLLRLAQRYGTSGSSWDDGDFNADGKVGFADLLALAQEYGRQRIRR